MTAAPPFRVRPARGADLLPIADLEAAAFSDPWPVDLLAVELAHPQAILLVASVEGALAAAVAGYAAFRHGGGEAEMLRLAVWPAERRRGLARALVEEGVRWLLREGVDTCHLEVRIDNLGAIAFYETLGFARTGRRRGYYRDGTDALVMSWALGGAV